MAFTQQHQTKFMIMTWGCQMNEDDSTQMANLLARAGFSSTNDPMDADIVVLNTCSVREKPEQKVRSRLGELRLLKQEKPNLIIGVCGCMAQRDGLELRKTMPFIDLVLGTANIERLPSLIEDVRSSRGFASALDLPLRNGKRPSSARHSRCCCIERIIGDVGLRMFVPVMYGCDNFCTYCIVPRVRGPERSRAASEIVAEVRELVDKGCREVTLVGQNVNSYRGESVDTDFTDLLEQLNDVEGLQRIRFTTSHPKDLSDRLIEAIAELPKVCEHLHLPMQSGDNEILRRMGRGYTAEQYLDLVDKLRLRVPGISLTTDVMVGFPGETDERFENTVTLVEAIGFNGAFMFAFNPRPETDAALMDDQVDGRTKTRRLVELIAVQNEITLRGNEERVGETFEVLTEGPSQRDASRLTGYTRGNKTVNFRAHPGLTGELVMVRASQAHPWGFSGEIE
ncbi:MAG: tRNA (N6-isopentenyl adenosine(37)-C2)-methylthiotransferase MiaB [Armatimonadetes bacterium]|nr:tRNA (N6-isopentenyl adenosine(37)-C2)-methylthiotransferase MiaB [Armatimonadota bacterium]